MWVMASRLLVVLALGGVCAVHVPVVFASDARVLGPLLAIRKSTNANRVEYELRVDDKCRPLGNEPVSGYFRRLTRGPNVRRELSFLERRVYGVKSQKVHRSAAGGYVDFSLRALPGRTLRSEVRRHDDACKVRTLARIAGQNAELLDVYLLLRGSIDVQHVEVKGRALANAKEVVERIEP